MTDIKDLIFAFRFQSIAHAKLLEKKMKMEQELERIEDETTDCHRTLTAMQQTLESLFPEPMNIKNRCEGCGGAIISRLCTCGKAHPNFQPTEQ